LVTPWAGAAIPDISGYTQSQYVSPFGGTPAQFVKGDGSLDSVSPVPVINGNNATISNGHPSFIICKDIGQDNTIYIYSAIYTEGNVVDIYVEPWKNEIGNFNMIGRFSIKTISNSGAGTSINTFSQNCSPYIYRFRKKALDLEYVCSWAVNIA
jgi:hypothetical protein